VFVNGEQVKQATIGEGDIIRIGSLSFMVELGREVTASDLSVRDVATCTNVLRSIADALPRSGLESLLPQRKAS
jgi:hypothetical protein